MKRKQTCDVARRKFCEGGSPIETGLLLRLVSHQLQHLQKVEGERTCDAAQLASEDGGVQVGGLACNTA